MKTSDELYIGEGKQDRKMSIKISDKAMRHNNL